MIKLKSKSKDLKDIYQGLPKFLSKNQINKQNRMARTFQYKTNSNQKIHSTNHFDNYFNNIKSRQFSSSKNIRRQSKYNQNQYPPLPITYNYSNKHITNENMKDSKRQLSNKGFIGSKLKKRLQKYMFFICLVNYSLRISYQRSEFKRFKLFVGKGNNSKLVKSLFAYRFWWVLTIDQNQAHLVWGQRSKKKIFNLMSQSQRLKLQPEEGQSQKLRRIKLKQPRQSKKHAQLNEFYSILSQKDRHLLHKQYNNSHSDNFQQDLKHLLKKTKLYKRKSIKISHNHLQHHRLLTNKKNLFYHLQEYCIMNQLDIFQYVPLTFHIKEGQQSQYQDVVKAQNQYQSKKEKFLWIVKPGENSNRGCGIEICKKVQQIKRHIEKQKIKNPGRTFIVQKYINPYLFHRRKFDIRCFVLVTSTPNISAYLYPVGYIRTSSFEFTIKNCSNKFIHLTNDAIQKKANEYSKFQNGNKITFQQFQKYLDMFQLQRKINFYTDIFPLMRQLVQISIKSTKNFNYSSKEHTFQIFGYDFMIDEQLKPWLIEINTNPCLQTSCQILNNIIPQMLQNAIKIAVDPVFKPPKIDDWTLNDLLTCSDRLLSKNRFQLVYSQLHNQ